MLKVVPWDSGPGTHILSPNSQTTDYNVFLSRLGTDGSYEWTEAIPDSYPNYFVYDGIAADFNGNAYLTGMVPVFGGTVTTTTAATTTATTTTSTNDRVLTAFLAKFSPSATPPLTTTTTYTSTSSTSSTTQIVTTHPSTTTTSSSSTSSSSTTSTTTSSTAETTTTTGSSTTTTLSHVNGAALYNSHCAGCHSGDALPANGRNIDGARVCSIKGALNGTKVFPTGVPQMAFLKSVLNDTQIQAISDYLNSGSVTGQQRYITACAGCHGVDARGGRVGESVRGENAAEISEAIYDESAMRFLNCLPEGDVGAIGGYLSGSAYSTTTRYATTTTRRSTTTTGSVTTTTKRCSRYDRRCNKPRHDRDDD